MVKVPDYARRRGETERKFKARKRKEIRAVIKAWEVFKCSSAYLPCYNHIREVGDLLLLVRSECGTKILG